METEPVRMEFQKFAAVKLRVRYQPLAQTILRWPEVDSGLIRALLTFV